MKKQIIALLTLTALFGAFNHASAWDKTTEKELKRVMYRNISALEMEDLELAVQDLDDSAKESTRGVAKQLFAQYDLTYRITSFKILSVKGNIAQVEVTQETRKINGPEFMDNETTGVHTLKKTASGWKIVATQIKTIKPL